MNELKSYTEYAVSTPTADFVIGFDFNYGEDAVNVTVDDVPATEAGYTVVYLNETTIQLSPSVPSGVVRLQRETDIDQTDHAYRAGAKFIAQTMDENFEQLRHSQQEVRDRFVKLADDTYEIIDTLNEVGQSAQDAADAAEVAAELANNAAAQVNDKVSYEDFNNKPHNAMLDRDAASAHPTSSILDASGETQQDINDFGGVKWRNKAGGYALGATVKLDNGDIVKSTDDGNVNDPNVDMTGWVKTNSAGQIFDESGKNQQQINDNQGQVNLAQALKNKRIVSVKDYGAIGDGTLHTLQEWVGSGKFSGLLAIQVAYPTATALNDSIDRVAIQTCIDQNVRSLLEDGGYWIDATINFKDYGRTLTGESVSSYGNGDHVRSKLLHKFNGDLVKINENLATSPRGRNKIENIGFVSDDLFTGKAIRVTSSQNHLINLSFYKFKDGAIRIGGKSYGTYIEKPSCDQCGSNGSYDISSDVDTGGTSANDYNTITVVIDGIFETPKTGAISLKESDPFYISRNYIEPFGSTSTSPMVAIKNSPSGNTKGWIYDNYLGSINGNDFAISAIGSDIHISKNIITDFAKGIYLSSQNGSAIGNDIKGYSSIGIQLASVNTNVNNDLIVNSNTLLSKSTGAIHGIIASGGVNGNLISSNIVRGKHDYYIRLISAFNTVVEGNFLLPVVGASTSGAGIYEDDNCTGNNVRNNSVQATTKYRRYSFDYDEFYLSTTSTPTTGVWVKGSIVKVPDPVSFGAIGYICTTAGTGAAAVWQKYGLIIKQIPARQAVVASDLATMVAAHNALLADLRAANIMAT